jgi:zinc protease
MIMRTSIARARVWLGTFALCAAGCGSATPLPPPPKAPDPVTWPAPAANAEATRSETPDAEFRKQPPAAGSPIVFSAPKIESFALKNGIKVLFVERRDLPIVSVHVVVKVGAGDLASARPGVMSFAGAMMEQGTDTRTALQLSDEYEALGASHGAWIEWDSGGSSIKVLSSKLDQALDLLADVTLHPSFPEKELDRLRARRLAAIQQEKNSPGAMAGNAVAASLYGRAHPYGHSLSGREDDVKKMKRADLVAAYHHEFTAANATIVAAGDVSREALQQKLEARFGAWKSGVAERGHVPAVLALKTSTPRIVVVDRPGAPQSQVYVAETGVAMSSPDRDAIGVMNAILGGMFSSRINLNLREAHAYTYGARSRFSMRHGPGPFTTGAAIFADKTVDAIKEIFKELDRMRADVVSDDELADAKESISLGMPGRFETVGEVSGALADLAVYDLPLDEYATKMRRVGAVTKEDVKRVALKLIHPATMRVIVVGDRAKLEEGLKALGFGPIEVRDAFGDVAKDENAAPAKAEKAGR